MKRTYHFFVGLLTVVLLFANTSLSFGQGATCATADPFCTSTVYAFPNQVNNGSAPACGNDYDCLSTTPNPVWYYMEIGTSGNLVFDITQSDGNGSGIDVDFILYGPFTNLANAQSECCNLGNGTAANNTVIDCSYAPAPQETATIGGAVAGEVYMMLITNFSNQTGTITFQQTGGTGSTNCAIVQPPCPTVGIHAEDASQNIFPFPIALDCDVAGWVTIREDDIATAGGIIAPAVVVDIQPTNANATGNHIYGWENNLPGPTWNNYWGLNNAPANSNYTFTMLEVDNGPGTTQIGVELCSQFAGANMPYTITDAACGGVITTGTWIAGGDPAGPGGPAGGCQFITIPVGSVGGSAVYTCPTCPPGSFVTTDYGRAFFNPSIAGPGSYDITYCFDNGCAVPNNCQGCATETIVVNNAFAATSLSYTTPVCQLTGGTISPTLTADAGGTYSATPAGLTINPTTGVITVGSSTPNTYTVSYFVGTALPSTCNATVNTTVTITAPTTPAFNPVAAICSGDPLAALPTTSTNGVTGTWSPAINNTSTTLYTFTPTAGLCATTTTMTITVNPNVTPTFTPVAAICSGDPLAALPTTSNNGVTGTWSPAINNTSTTLYTFTPTAGVCATTTTMTITVNPPTTPTFTPVAAICNGDPLAALPTTSTNGITGTWSPAINNTSTTLYTFTPTAGLCATTTTMTITVNPNVTPTFTPVAAICSGDPLAALPTTSTNGVTGTWSPAINNTSTTLYTFTPTAGVCATTTTMTITVNPNVTPTFTPVAAICSGDPLATLPTTSNNGVTGTWSPAINNTSTTLYTFTPTAGVCATTTTMTIIVTPNVTPTFTPVAAICNGDPLAALPTTSNNGVTGTWSPAINNTSTTLYTFTPTAGLCATTTTMTITVNPNVTPTFTPVAAICSGDPLAALPTTSNNGVTGTWSPAIDNTITTLYTFTPTAGLCSPTTTMTITVNPNVTPTFTPVNPICDGDPLAALPTTSNNGITGTWSPAINNTSTTLYTFTPTAGVCATTATMTITVTPNTVPTFTPVAAICNGDPLAALPTISNNGVTGTWSPAINNTSTTLYTFTPTAGLCATTSTMTITVNPNVTPTFAPVAAICDGAPLAALPTTSTNGITGTWSPAINNTSTTLYTFTPTAGVCATTTTMTITVNPNDDPNFAYASGTYCLTGTDPSPSVITTPGGTFTITAPGSINPTTGLIDLGTSGLGAFTVTYNTPGANPCPSSTTFPVTITAAPSAAFSYDGPTYCQDATAPILTYGPGASGGVFTTAPVGLSINPGTGAVNLVNSTPGLYTVYNTIVAAGGCAAALDSTTIEIFQMDSALFSYSPTTYCLTGTDPSATLGGNATPGGVFTITAPGVINAGNGTIDLSSSGLGVFTVYYNTTIVGNPCPSIDSVSITITSAPTAGFVYDAPQFCQDSLNPVLSFVGAGSAGAFTSSPVGLSLNGITGAVDLALSTPGLYTVYNTIVAAGGCAAAVDSTTIEVLQVDSALFSYSNGTYCLTGTDPAAIITGTTGGTFTITAPGVINPTTGLVDLTSSGLGTFTIYYNTNTAGNACSASDSLQIIITSSPTAGFVYDAGQFCQDSIAPVLTMNAGASSGVFSASPAGLTIDAAGNITLATSTPGIYTVYNNVAAGGGCAAAVDSTTIEVLQVDDASFSFANGSTYCLGDPNPTATLNGTVGGGFTISAPGSINGTTGEIDIAASGAGTFTVYYNTVNVGNPCSEMDSVVITINPQNSINPDPWGPICFGDPITLTSTGSGNGTITWYSDAAGTNVLQTGSPYSPSVPGPGTYTYYVNEAGACPSQMDSVVVIVGGVVAVINAAPTTGPIPLSVFFGNGSTTGAGITYDWDFGDGNTSTQFEPTNVYNSTGTFAVTLIVSDGICSDTATIIIDAFGESAILIPNVFTPNGDGSNDIFTVDGVNLESVEGEIFNRWGQLMFSWDIVKGSWDGRTLAGTEAPDGTYFYIITAKGFDGTEYFEKGGFSLIR